MQDDAKNKYNQERDPFYDYFRNTLYDHELFVDRKIWTKISAQLVAPKKKYILYSKSFVIPAVLLLSVIFVGLIFWNKESSEYNIPLGFNQEKLFDSLIFQSPNNLIDNSQSTLFVKLNSPKDNEKKTSEDIDFTNIHIIESNHSNENYQFKVEPIDAYAQKLLKEKTSTPQSTSKHKRINYEYYFLNNNEDLAFFELPKEHRLGWELLASISISGSNSEVHNNHTMILDGPLQINGDRLDHGFLNTSKANGISDVQYDSPFSIALLISKRIKSNIRIETGISYSYLSTRYKDSKNKLFSASLKLHYVGLPVNLSVDFWNINSRFKMYGSGGFTVEKGIKYNLSQELFDGNTRAKNKRSIRGLQWSLNLSSGISLRLYDNMNIYIEPRLSYFFDNNQPISIRTEEKYIFSLNGGLKFEF